VTPCEQYARVRVPRCFLSHRACATSPGDLPACARRLYAFALPRRLSATSSLSSALRVLGLWR